jgi:RNA polymerase sigma-70 factor (sigma-E family)
MRPWYVHAESARRAAPGHGWAPLEIRDAADADEAVARLYRDHASGLVRLAVVILGDYAAAEDVVQDAFCGLCRRWDELSDLAKALNYTRSAVINGCRSLQRYQSRRTGRPAPPTATASAEAMAMLGEEHRAVLAAVAGLPPRQREAIALRFFADLDEGEIARAMGVSRGTVKSTLSRGIAALGQQLGESS